MLAKKRRNLLPQLERAFGNWQNCQVWFRNIVKHGKYTLVKFANFVYFCTTRGKALPHLPKFTFNGKAFPCVIQKFKKFANFASLHFLYLSIFRHQIWQFY